MLLPRMNMVSKSTKSFFNLYQFYSVTRTIRYFSSNRIPKIFKNRQQHIQQIKKKGNYDVIIIGGGCNGVGTYVQSCLRGFKTLLIEKDDFGSGASSKSTKLFHGGVRYLQQVFQLSNASLADRKEKFRLVTQAIMERSLALQNYGYLSSKLQFILPAKNWLWGLYYYIGLLMYYLIFLVKSPSAGPKFVVPKLIGSNQMRKIFPYMSENYQCGVIYQDGVFNDSRLLILSLLTGTELDYSKTTNSKHQFQSSQSGNFVNKAQLTEFIKDQGKIIGIKFIDKITNQQISVNGRYVVDCTGAWTDKTRKIDYKKAVNCNLSVAGSHITYSNKYFNHQYGLCVPSKDGRIILVVPWLGHVIAGTTEVTFQAPTNQPTMNEKQRDFIRNAVQQTFEKLNNSLIRQTQQSAFCGLRSLVLNIESKDTKSISRDFVIRKSDSGLFSLNGGKWTIFRKMGQSMIQKLVKQQQMKGFKREKSSKTKNLKLIGSCQKSVERELTEKYGKIGKHLYEFYGSFAMEIIKGDTTIIHDVYTKAQIQWVIKNEMPTDLQDIILRRTRIGFLYKKEQIKKLTKEIAKIFGEVYNLNTETINVMYEQTIDKIQKQGYGF